MQKQTGSHKTCLRWQIRRKINQGYPVHLNSADILNYLLIFASKHYMSTIFISRVDNLHEISSSIAPDKRGVQIIYCSTKTYVVGTH